MAAATKPVANTVTGTPSAEQPKQGSNAQVSNAALTVFKDLEDFCQNYNKIPAYSEGLKGHLVIQVPDGKEENVPAKLMHYSSENWRKAGYDVKFQVRVCRMPTQIFGLIGKPQITFTYLRDNSIGAELARMPAFGPKQDRSDFWNVDDKESDIEDVDDHKDKSN